MTILFSDEWIENNCSEYRPPTMRLRNEMTLGNMARPDKKFVPIRPPRNVATLLTQLPKKGENTASGGMYSGNNKIGVSEDMIKTMITRGRAQASITSMESELQTINRDPFISDKPFEPTLNERRIGSIPEQRPDLIVPFLGTIEGVGIMSRYRETILKRRSRAVDVPRKRIRTTEDPSTAQNKLTAFSREQAFDFAYGDENLPLPQLGLDKAPSNVIEEVRADVREGYTPEQTRIAKERAEEQQRELEVALDMRADILTSDVLGMATMETFADVASDRFTQYIFDVESSVNDLIDPETGELTKYITEEATARELKDMIKKVANFLHIKNPELNGITELVRVIFPEGSPRDIAIGTLAIMTDNEQLKLLNPTSGDGNLDEASIRRREAQHVRFMKNLRTRENYERALRGVIGDRTDEFITKMDRIDELQDRGMSYEEALMEVGIADISEEKKRFNRVSDEVSEELINDYLYYPDFKTGEVLLQDIMYEILDEDLGELRSLGL